ncbi:MAG: POTRA domain-containing protein, partial [Polyangiaceae bacterium]
MQGLFAARCPAWMRCFLVIALCLLVTSVTARSAFAQGAPAPSAAAPAAPPSPPGTDPNAKLPETGELPSEPPTSAALPPGEAEMARGLPLQRIEVTGNRRVTPEDVLTYIRERTGQPFRPETLTQDVRELWNSGFFDDIEVELDRHDEGVELRFVVRERPSIST